MQTPRVTIAVPVYNLEDFIAQTLDSIRDQVFTDFEVLIVDDGSTDNSFKVIEPYLDDPRFRYLRQENAGPAVARNKALAEARGEWFAQLDGDDVWLPEFLETQMRLLQENPQANLAYGNAITFWEDKVGAQLFDGRKMPEGDITLRLFRWCVIALSATVTRTEDLRAIGGYDEEVNLGEDYDLWLRLARHRIWAVPCREPLVKYRIRPQSRCSAGLRNLKAQVGIVLRALQREDRPRMVRHLCGTVRYVKSLVALESARIAAAEDVESVEDLLWQCWTLHPRRLRPFILALLCWSSRITRTPWGREFVISRFRRASTAWEKAEQAE